MAQAILVEMRAQIRLEIGATVRFCPDYWNLKFGEFDSIFRHEREGQECVVVELSDTPPALPASLEEPDDAEAEVFARLQNLDAKDLYVSVQFSDNAECKFRSVHFVALGARHFATGERNSSWLRAYTASPDARQIASIMEVRKNIKV